MNWDLPRWLKRPMPPWQRVLVGAVAIGAVAAGLAVAIWLALFVAVSAALLLVGRALLMAHERVVPDRFVERLGDSAFAARRRAKPVEDEIVVEGERIER